jgi:4-diphosphocytidyl-2-C-methyl-D-erythritol kinase
MPRIKVEAPAKLNLHLQIGDRRPDGFHNIESLFVALAFGDTLSFETVHKPQVVEICMDWQLPCNPDGGFPAGKVAGKATIPPEENIISKAVSLFRSRTGYEKGLKITVEKRIPLGGGLGGGSSDAAAALLALNHLASEGKNLLSDAELTEMGALLGSDVPFFVNSVPRYEREKNLTTEDTEEHRVLIREPSFSPCNSVYSVVKNSSFFHASHCFHSAAWISGRGERVQPLELPELARNLFIVLVNPGFSSDTAEAYRLFDEWRGKNTPVPPKDSAFLLKSFSGPPENWPFSNDFLTVFDAAGKTSDQEPSAMSSIYTSYQHIISGLREQGADFAGLSGSGSTCFGVFSGREKAEAAREKLLLYWPLVICTFLLAYPAAPCYNLP